MSKEYTTGNAEMKGLVELATKWTLQHRHAEPIIGPSEHNRKPVR